MNRKFKLEHSVYALGAFIAVISIMLLIARSEAVLKFRYFNELSEQTVLRQEVNVSRKLPSYLLLTGPDQPDFHYSLKNRLEMMGKDVAFRSITTITSETDLTGYASIVVATEQIDLLEETDVLLRFVKNGGSIFFAIRPSPGPALSTLYQSIGLVEIGNFVETSGIKLEQPFFGENGDTDFTSETIVNSSLSVRLSSDAELFASSSSGIPLLWKATYGEGTFIVFNGTMFSIMTHQALFVKGIQQSSDHVIMPIVNARVTELSGFPFIVPDGRDLSPSYTNRDYYRTVVWPGLQRIDSKYSLNYTASYVAPDDVVLSNKGSSRVFDDFQLYGRELLRMGGEIAVQESVLKTAEQSLRSHKISGQHIQEALPGYLISSTVSVSPQTNVNLMGEVSAILAPNAYVKEVEETIVLPKTVEGFNPDDGERWKLYNEVASSGFYSHSLYPYRFYEEKNAEEQTTAFDEFQQSIKNQIPWIRSLTLSEAGNAAYAYINSDIYEEQDGDKLTFYATAMKENEHTYYYFSTKQTIAETENCNVIKIGKDLYLVVADKLTFSIILGGLQ